MVINPNFFFYLWVQFLPTVFIGLDEGGLGDVPRDKLLHYDIVRSKISPHSLDNSMQNQIKEYLQEN